MLLMRRLKDGRGSPSDLHDGPLFGMGGCVKRLHIRSTATKKRTTKRSAVECSYIAGICFRTVSRNCVSVFKTARQILVCCGIDRTITREHFLRLSGLYFAWHWKAESDYIIFSSRETGQPISLSFIAPLQSSSFLQSSVCTCATEADER